MEKMTANVMPRYYQIKQLIKKSIIDKDFEVGEKIPSEKELSKKYQASRVTVRQALTQLTHEGILRSRRGDGTYVNNNLESHDTYSLEAKGLMSDLYSQISYPKTKSVDIQRKALSKSIREKLKLPDIEKEYIQIKRVRLLNNNFFVYTVNHLPVDIGRQIKKSNLLKKPMLKILEEDLKIKFMETFLTIEASFAHGELLSKLRVPSGYPILLLEGILYSSDFKPIQFVQSYYPGDIYKFNVRLKA